MPTAQLLVEWVTATTTTTPGEVRMAWSVRGQNFGLDGCIVTADYRIYYSKNSAIASAEGSAAIETIAQNGYIDISYNSATNGTIPLSYTDVPISGLEPGETYYFRVLAVILTAPVVVAGNLPPPQIYNPAAVSSTLTPVSATLPPQLSTPTNLVAVAGNQQVILSWTQVPNAYQITILTDEGVSIATFSGTSTTYTITGLANENPYSFGIKAIGDNSPYLDSNVASFPSVTPTSNNGGDSGSGGVVCFLANAPVLTPTGYKRIDSLAVGDIVRTADGRDVAIQRVKHQRVVAPSASVNPYVIPAGQFGATQALAISPRHAVAVPGRGMVEARELGLRQLSMKAAFDYYNLELPEWDNMVVAGVEVESLAPKKRVVMTAAQFRELVGGRSVDLARLARMATVRADGSVDVTLTRKARRI